MSGSGRGTRGGEPGAALELVVARHREDLAWLRRVPRVFTITVYDKSGEPGAAHPLPNVGDEAQTYLHHVVGRYGHLADVTVFCQGKPFDHAPDFHRTLRGIAREGLGPDGFRSFGFVVDRDDADGALFRTWRGNPGKRGLPLARFWGEVFGGTVPDEFVFFPGAQFAVTAAQARLRPLEFYRRALSASVFLPDAGHCFERCWDRVFNADGIPAAFRGRGYPLYLRPIRRLGLTWADVPAVGPEVTARGEC